MTAQSKILEFLAKQVLPVPLHEMKIDGVSQTSCSARLRELARAENGAKVRSVPVPGKRYTAWVLNDPQPEFNLSHTEA